MRKSEFLGVSLFSGIGAMDLAFQWAGGTTVAMCEIDPFCQRILDKHWPLVPLFDDVKELSAEALRRIIGNVRINCIFGGFPCQPFSVAGRKKGQEDNRYLWPEFKRLIGDIRPDFVVGENVPGVIKLAGDRVCKDLECEGYSVRIFNFEAAAVGAFHRRDRVFFVAHRNDLSLMEDSGCELLQGSVLRREAENESGEGNAYIPERSGEARTAPVSNSDSIRCYLRGFEREGVHRKNPTCHEADPSGQAVPDSDSSRCEIKCESIGIQQALSNSGSLSGGRIKSCMGCMAHGTAHELDGDRGIVIDENFINLNYWNYVPEPRERVKRDVSNRVAQLRALGNAVVPQQVYPVFKAIIDTAKWCGY